MHDLQRKKAVNAEDRVIKIAFPNAILESAILVLLFEQELSNELSRFGEEFWREPRHLQHLEAETHFVVRARERRKHA